MFYDIFSKLCCEKGISKSKAAENVGLNRTAVIKWKNGSFPSGETLQKIANYFDVSIEYLMGEEKKPTAENDSELVNNDEELTEYLEELKNRPELRMMFQLAKGATKEDVEKAVEIIEAFLK